MTRQLPAGLSPLNSESEFFSDNGQPKALYQGQVVPFREMPLSIINQVRFSLDTDTKALAALENWGIYDPILQLETFVNCRFGGFDNSPDFNNGMGEGEYWPCQRRGNCEHEGVICSHIKVSNGFLTKREIDVMKLIYLGLINKEIAMDLEISVFTVENHIKNLKKKCEAQTRTDLTRIASQKKIIPYERLKKSESHCATSA